MRGVRDAHLLCVQSSASRKSSVFILLSSQTLMESFLDLKEKLVVHKMSELEGIIETV